MTEWEEEIAMTFFMAWGADERPYHDGGMKHGGLWRANFHKIIHAAELGLINIHPVGNYRAFTPTAKGRALLALMPRV